MINLPAAFTERMKQMLGREYDAFIASYDKERSQGLRVNGLKTDPAEFAKTAPFSLNPVAWAAEGFAYGAEDRPGRHPYHDAGVYYIQEPSAMAVVSLLDPKPGEKVLDLCAAPGGKTILAAEFAGEAGHVVSRDISEYKTDLIRENLERMNRRNVEVQVYDATVHDPEKEKYADVVLMDVPCSGLGVMGKKRDIKYHATPESLQSITELQRQIVAAGWQYVKPHGVLLYSTCTIHRGENQEMAAWITENFPFVLEEERQLLPGTDETDGFYYARLRRKA